MPSQGKLAEKPPGGQVPSTLQAHLPGRGGFDRIFVPAGQRLRGFRAAPGDVPAGECPGVLGVPGGDLEVFGAERDRDDADRDVHARAPEGVAGEVAGRDDQVRPAADADPILAGVVFEVAVGDVGNSQNGKITLGRAGVR